MFVWCTRRTSCPAACCCSASSRGVDQLHRDQSVVIQLLLLTGAHCANHNIAHVKCMVLPWYHTTHASTVCVCARMSVSLPAGETRDPKGVRHVRLPGDHSPRPRVALITPYGLGSVTTLPLTACWIALSPVLVYKHHTSNALPSTHWGSTPRGHSTRSARTCSRAATRHFVPAQIRHVQRVLLHIE